MRGYSCVSRFSLLLLFLLAPLGCGKGYQVAPVSGRVTLDGKPARNAEVSFVPLADLKVPYSVARTDDQGKYTLQLARQEIGTEGAVVGSHRVIISIDRQNTKMAPMPKSKMAMRDRSEFNKLTAGSEFNGKFVEACTVPPEGKSDANFDLKSK
jgi:hypothetical protein